MFAASKTASASTGGYQISRSLRFNSADSAYLNRTPASASNQKTWTWSGWVKRSTLGGYNTFFNAGGNGFVARFNNPTDYLEVYNYSGGYQLQLITAQVFRDVSAWYHIVIVLDTTPAQAASRCKLYVNGVQVTSFYGTPAYPNQNADLLVNAVNVHTIGNTNGIGAYNDGLLTEVNFIDGQALTPSSFGETNAQTGVWTPIAYSGSYGTNGFYLNFSDNSNTTAATLGKDYSGNGNNWTPNNFSVTAGVDNDSMVDVPTPYGVDTGVGGTVRGNYCTLNPLNAGNSAYLNNGNLAITNPSEGAWRTGVATIAMSSGKWYAEVTVTNNNLLIGIDKASVVFTGTTTFIGGSPTGWGVLYTGQVYNNSGVVYNNSSYAAGDIIGMTFDADTGVLTWYKNNVAMGQTITGLTSGPYVFGFSANSAGNGSINFGQRAFAYTAPSGFKALCTQNLPTPAIGATTATQAGKYFNPVLYTGNAGTLAVTGVGFQPDWTWIKLRSAVASHALYDAVRGVQKQISSDSTAAETTQANGLTAFGSDGFTVGTLGNVNGSGSTYVAWNWKANGSGSTNTAGSITSTVSANTTSGFSIITWTGNATQNATIGHGLGTKPAFFVVKNRTSGPRDWPVKFNTFSTSQYIYLNGTGAVASFGFYFPTEPTSSVIYLGSDADVNGNGNSMVCYAFSEVAGYSKFGSYTGNGSTDGPFIYCGFRPRYILFKTTAAINQPWGVADTTRSPYNLTNLNISPTYDTAENSGYAKMDILSNGFKLREDSVFINGSGSNYIFAAFAENPFKYSLAR